MITISCTEIMEVYRNINFRYCWHKRPMRKAVAADWTDIVNLDITDKESCFIGITFNSNDPTGSNLQFCAMYLRTNNKVSNTCARLSEQYCPDRNVTYIGNDQSLTISLFTTATSRNKTLRFSLFRLFYLVESCPGKCVLAFKLTRLH